jgi:hypothetical protein
LARPVGFAVSSSSSATDEQLVEQVVDAQVLLGRHLDGDGVATPRLGNEALLGELVRTRCGSAFSLSILLTATTIGTSAALAWLMASTVWGMTPSSAADHEHDDVGDLRARARIFVNAAWPGCR